MMVSGHDRRDAEIDIASLAVQRGTKLLSGGEHGDHMPADDTVVRCDIPEGVSKVAERDIASVVGN